MAVSTEDIYDIGGRFLGGRGVNNYLLTRELSPGIDPLGSANVVILGTGLLVGTGYPGANRLNIASLSPLTGGLASSSAGGGLAIALRSAGVDHLLVTGKALKPVYLYVDHTKIEIRDASWLWGKTTRETVSLIREQIGDENVQVACIGPAGEKLVLNSCIILTGGRAAGRCGMGAVMASKGLKAIAVRGSGRIEVSNTGEFRRQIQKAIGKVRGSKVRQKLAEVGTVSYGTLEGDPYRLVASRNFQFSEPTKRFHIAEFEQFRVGHTAVPSCPLSCAQEYRVSSGKYRGCHVEKLEGNSRGDFGERLAVEDAAAVLRAHELCQLFGLDVDNTSGAIAWAFECYQRGLLNTKDTDGLKLEWGNDDVVMSLIEKIANRDGFGDILADGCERAARRMGHGSEEFCIHIKGQALQETLRAYKGWALGVVVSERGGGHTRGAPCTEFGNVGLGSSKKVWSQNVSEKLFAIPNAGDSISYENKAILVIYYEQFHAILDSIGLCYFMSNWIDPNLLSPDDIATVLSSATGQSVSSDSLMKTGESIVCLGKFFNQIYAGFDREDDYPPERLMCKPVETGPYKGERLERTDWDHMLDDYYTIHKWDLKTGSITNALLKELELNEHFKIPKERQ